MTDAQLTATTLNRPTQNMSNQKTGKPTGYKRVFNPLLAMLVLFGLPYALSWYFLYSGDPVAFENPNNQGELVSPVIPLGEFSLPLKDGAALTQKDFEGNWSIITVTSSCETACQETLFTMRQIRKAMGVNRQVIKPILLLQNPQALDAFDIDFNTDFPQLALVSGQNASTALFTESFSKTTPVIENSIFMVDPFGNLMMVYPAGTEQKGMMDDLKRLLKVNQPKL